jgi:hypothetical protein
MTLPTRCKPAAKAGFTVVVVGAVDAVVVVVLSEVLPPLAT